MNVCLTCSLAHGVPVEQVPACVDAGHIWVWGGDT